MAEAAAAAALAIDSTNTKARFRRAKALVAMGALTKSLKELTQLEAVPEIASTKPFKALMKKVKLKLKQSRKAESDRAGAALRQAFASGGGGIGEAPEAPSAAAESAAESTAEATVVTPTLAALQQAHDEIPAGGTLRVPAGSYTGSGSFVITKPISIQGEGKESTVLNFRLEMRGSLTTGAVKVD